MNTSLSGRYLNSATTSLSVCSICCSSLMCVGPFLRIMSQYLASICGALAICCCPRRAGLAPGAGGGFVTALSLTNVRNALSCAATKPGSGTRFSPSLASRVENAASMSSWNLRNTRSRMATNTSGFAAASSASFSIAAAPYAAMCFSSTSLSGSRPAGRMRCSSLYMRARSSTLSSFRNSSHFWCSTAACVRMSTSSSLATSGASVERCRYVRHRCTSSSMRCSTRFMYALTPFSLMNAVDSTV
mmetsp:Transcript_36846/g.90173  ORF Transcript_36846/g.90173 Transcript_36846/m.90173 type:complete len:245 (+) Transcript_36846:1046-1780(+)